MTETNKTEKAKPQRKAEFLDVRALGWYNNGTLLDKPWSKGEMRRIPVNLYKRLQQDDPGNWEIV